MDKLTLARKRFYSLSHLAMNKLKNKEIKITKEVDDYIQKHVSIVSDSQTLEYTTINSQSRCILQASFVKIQNLLKKIILETDENVLKTKSQVNSKLGYAVEYEVFNAFRKLIEEGEEFKDVSIYNDALAVNEELKIKTQADFVLEINGVVFFVDVKKFNKNFEDVFNTEFLQQQFLEYVLIENVKKKIDYVVQIRVYMKNKNIINNYDIKMIDTKKAFDFNLIRSKHKDKFKSIKCEYCSHKYVCPFMTPDRYDFLQKYTLKELREFFIYVYNYVMLLDEDIFVYILSVNDDEDDELFVDVNKFVRIVAQNYFEYLKSKKIIQENLELEDVILNYAKKKGLDYVFSPPRQTVLSAFL